MRSPETPVENSPFSEGNNVCFLYFCIRWTIPGYRCESNLSYF